MRSEEIAALLGEYGITVISSSPYPKPGETKAIGTIRKIIAKRGEDHMRFLLESWTGTNIRRMPMDQSTLWAMSDTILAAEKNFPDVMQNDLERWFTIIDGIPVHWFLKWSADLDGMIPRRHIIVGMMYERLKRIIDHPQFELMDGRK